MVENVSQQDSSAGGSCLGPTSAVESCLRTIACARALATLRIRSNGVLSMSGNTAREEDRVVRVGRRITGSLER